MITEKIEAAKKWRRLALVVTAAGIIIFSLPMIPDRFKYMLAIPLYAVFVYVYYKYLCLKKDIASGAGHTVQQETTGRGRSHKTGNRPGKTSSKKGR